MNQTTDQIVQITTPDGEATSLVWDGKTEASLWSVVGEYLSDDAVSKDPGEIEVTVPGNGTADIIRKENGNLTPGPNGNTISVKVSEYPVKKLVRIDVESNTHQMYVLLPNGFPSQHVTLEVSAMWGQTGGNGGGDSIENLYVLKKPWPSWFFHVKLSELLARGYEDYTDMLVDEEEIRAEFDHCFGEGMDNAIAIPGEDPAVELYEHLKGTAREFLTEIGVEKDFLSGRAPYSAVQTRSARKLHARMAGQMVKIRSQADPEDVPDLVWLNAVADFNADSEKLIALTGIPFKTSDADGRNKKRRQVSDFVVSTALPRDKQAERMEELLDFWNTTVSAMEAVAAIPKAKKKEGEEERIDAGPFGNCRVTMEDPKVAEKLLKQFHAPDRFTYRMYRIEPHDFEKRQQAYRKQTGADKTLLLLHGSPTPNWISLIRTHPVKNPGFTTAGKALGWASAYLARDFEKSLHYTSLSDGFYAHGSEDIGYIAIFRVAYRNVFYPKTFYDCEDDMRAAGCDLVDAKASATGFAMDELTVYNDEQLCMQELIEIRPKQ